MNLTQVAMACSQVASLMVSGPQVVAVCLPVYIEAGGPADYLRRIVDAA